MFLGECPIFFALFFAPVASLNCYGVRSAVHEGLVAMCLWKQKKEEILETVYTCLTKALLSAVKL